ncbi:3D domain-containing protein [Anaerobacillus sp. MEB173]|uniref:3D domain-containing protein n=1 Tax=Anaerobacillus sp. MEB173 TaxID=3383345 RepID=UPI003F92847D
MKLVLTAIFSMILFITVFLYYTINDYFTSKQMMAFNFQDGIVDIYEVTAYTAGPESTGKTPDHPAYRITASGEYVKEKDTLACPPELPFGTKVYIPYLNETFTCKDRGGAIKGKTLDIYMEQLDDALEFGRKQLEVTIMIDEQAN